MDTQLSESLDAVFSALEGKDFLTYSKESLKTGTAYNFLSPKIMRLVVSGDCRQAMLFTEDTGIKLKQTSIDQIVKLVCARVSYGKKKLTRTMSSALGMEYVTSTLYPVGVADESVIYADHNGKYYVHSHDEGIAASLGHFYRLFTVGREEDMMAYPTLYRFTKIDTIASAKIPSVRSSADGIKDDDRLEAVMCGYHDLEATGVLLGGSVAVGEHIYSAAELCETLTKARKVWSSLIGYESREQFPYPEAAVMTVDKIADGKVALKVVSGRVGVLSTVREFSGVMTVPELRKFVESSSVKVTSSQKQYSYEGEQAARVIKSSLRSLTPGVGDRDPITSKIASMRQLKREIVSGKVQYKIPGKEMIVSSLKVLNEPLTDLFESAQNVIVASMQN